MTQDEFNKRLYAELVQCIAMDLFSPSQKAAGYGDSHQRWDSSKGMKGEWIWHSFASTFERVFRVLLAFPAFEPVDGEGRPAVANGGLANVRLAVDVKDIAKRVLANFPSQPPPLLDVLTSYIELCTHHGSISSSRNSFCIEVSYTVLFGLLARAGYIGQVDDRFRWTDKIAPAMAAIYLWDAERSFADNYEKTLGLIWQTMPEKLKQQIFFQGKIDVMSFAVAYSTCWLGDCWDLTKMQVPGRDKITLSGGGVAVCEEYR